MERAGRTAARAAGIDLAASLLRDARNLVSGVILTAAEDDVTVLAPQSAEVFCFIPNETSPGITARH